MRRNDIGCVDDKTVGSRDLRCEDGLPFSSLKDPSDLARAHAAIQAAWEQLRPSLPDDPALREKRRLQLAYIVVDLLRVAQNDDDLATRAVARFRERVGPDALDL